MRRCFIAIQMAAVLLAGCSKVVGRYTVVTTKNLSFENRESELVGQGITGKSEFSFVFPIFGYWAWGYKISSDNAVYNALRSTGGDYMTNVTVEYKKRFYFLYNVTGFYATGDVYRFKPSAGSQSAARSQEATAAPQAGYNEALGQYSAGNHAAALNILDALLKAEPGNWQAWQLKGNCHYSLGDMANAKASYRRSLGLNPGNADLKRFCDSLPAQ